MTTSEQYQLEKTTRLQTDRKSDHVYDTILRENIPATHEFSHENTLNETKDVPHLQILTDITTSLRRIKVVCLVLMIMVIVMATSIGVLLSELKKGEGAAEGNVDKQSTRLTRLESDFQDLLAALEENNNTISQLESDRIKDRASIHQQTTNIAQLESDRTNDLASIQRFTNRITDLEARMTECMNTTSHTNESLSKYTSYASAFTAWYPSAGKVTDPIKFPTVLSNIGSDYDSSSGKFTCRFPGIYMFILNLYKHYSSAYDRVYCYIQKNGGNTVLAYNYPPSSAAGGYYEASNSVVLHLNHSDVVTVGGCYGYIFPYSSFTGFLVKAD